MGGESKEDSELDLETKGLVRSTTRAVLFAYGSDRIFFFNN